MSDRDVQDLKYLTKLTILDVNNNNLTNLSFASGMIELEEVWADNNKISDISGLKNCTKLKTISLENCPINDLSPLQNCRNLELVQLIDVVVTDSQTFEASLCKLHIVEGGRISINRWDSDNEGHGYIFPTKEAALACKEKIIKNSGISNFKFQITYFDANYGAGTIINMTL